jgi:hypothetical protein
MFPIWGSAEADRSTGHLPGEIEIKKIKPNKETRK